MRSILSFLALLSFLTACAQPSVPHTPKAPRTSSPKAPSDYEAFVSDSPIARYLRGEPQKRSKKDKKVAYICVPTGAFNLAATTTKYILVEIWCVERHPMPGQGISLRPVKDKRVERIPEGKYDMYPLPFKEAVISVLRKRGADPHVTIHYHDEKGVVHHVPLPKKSDKAYEYSIEELNLEPLEGEIRTM